MGNFVFLKSWAIVPRGTTKQKIWLGTFSGSVLIIFISFSTIEKKLVIFFLPEMINKFEKKIVGGHFLVYLWPLLKVAQNVNATAGVSNFPRISINISAS